MVSGGSSDSSLDKIDMVGDFLDAVAQLVHQHDAERQLALEHVGRLDADRRRASRAPFAIRVLVAGALRVLERGYVGGGDHLVLDRRIDPLEKRQRHVARKVDRAWWPVENETRLRHVHVELLEDRTGLGFGVALRTEGGVGLGVGVGHGLLLGPRLLGDDRLDVAGKQRKEFPLDRARARPVLETDELAASSPAPPPS